MIRNFSSSVKNAFLTFYKIWRDILFPPLCVICKEKRDTKIFCPLCWELCAFPDPAGRCPHCFVESDGLCRKCIKNPRLKFTQGFVFEETPPAFHLARQDSETVVAFMLAAWAKLNWEMPDLVLPMLGSKEVAFLFAEKIERPLGIWDIKAIEEELTLMVICVDSTMEEVEKALQILAKASPKRGYVLSLFSLF